MAAAKACLCAARCALRHAGVANAMHAGLCVACYSTVAAATAAMSLVSPVFPLHLQRA